MLAILDAGPLYAAIDARDSHHQASLEILSRQDLTFVLPTMIVAEVCYFLAKRYGALVEAKFLAGLGEFDVEGPQREDWPRISDLVYQYRNFPLGGTDASVIALAERLDTDLIITLDRRHFTAVRPRHAATFRLLPA